MHGIEQRRSHHLGRLLTARPSSSNSSVSEQPNNTATSTLYLPLAVIEHGASYCNRVDQYGRPIVFLKLGILDTNTRIYTDEDYIYSMLHTLER